MKTEKTFILTGGLLALLFLIRTGEYLLDYLIGDKDGSFSNPAFVFERSLFYRILVLSVVLLTFYVIRKRYSGHMGKREHLMTLTLMYGVSVVVISLTGNSVLIACVVCVLPFCFFWKWGRYSIPVIVILLFQFLPLDIKLSHIEILVSILYCSWLLYPNRLRLDRGQLFGSPIQPHRFRSSEFTEKSYFTTYQEAALSVFFSLPFFLWLGLRYLSLDFWYDEVNSLKTFIFVPLLRTITDYETTNNHIFFNLMSNIYLKLMGIKDIYALMDNPATIRLLVLLFSGVTLLYVFLIGKRFFNGFVAVATIVILVTTVPFYNFAIQVRGYALSMMLLYMLLYYVWMFEEIGRLRHGILIVCLVSLALYTAPLNLYVVAAIAIFFFIKAIHVLWGKWRKEDVLGIMRFWKKRLWIEHRIFGIVFLITIGVFVGVACYIPVIPSVLNGATDTKRVLRSYGFFKLSILQDLMPLTFKSFVSQRLLLVLVAFVGWIGFWFIPKERKYQRACSKYLLCLSVLLLPFLFSFIRGDMALTRIFVNLAPIFALTVAISLYSACYLFTRLPLEQKKWTMGILLVLAVYCHGTFASALHERDAYLFKHNLLEDRGGVGKAQDIYHNFYQAHFRPLQLVREFVNQNYSPTTPVLVGYDYEFDGMAMTAYLEKFNILYQRISVVEKSVFDEHDRIHVFTAYPNKFRKMFLQTYPEAQCHMVNTEIGFHNIFLCQKSSDSS